MFNQGSRFLRSAILLISCFALAGVSWAAHVNTNTLPSGKSKSQKLSETQRTRRRLRRLARSRTATHTASAAHIGTVTRASVSTHRRHRYYERFSMSSFADSLTEGDVTTGEDSIVRQAAIDALGNMNGT